MEYYAGVDVSLKESSVCVMDTAGKVVREVKLASGPEALVRNFDELRDCLSDASGSRPGPAGREAVLVETQHVKAALAAFVEQ